MMTPKISGATQVVGLFGHPVSHTLSPAMHNAAFASLNLPYVYLPFAVEPARLAEAVRGIRGLNLRGVNVTIPHKERVMAYLDRVTPEAELIGAVNTIVNDQGVLTGHNTDGAGFVKSLEEQGATGLQNRRVLILGAGGAARSVAVSLALGGAGRIVIAGRTMDKAREITTVISEKISDKCASVLDIKSDRLPGELAEADIIINTTPLGMYPHHEIPPFVDLSVCHPGALICDLVYNPKETSLLKAARQRRLETLSGIGMLIWQGVLAFQLWTGQKPPVELMRHTVEKHFIK
ncbi:MAG TPA: shikimate dehydrogenase [Negativicutes bacterium]|nr:shikimate dehydrogenase [Negativicutes bacterium]